MTGSTTRPRMVWMDILRGLAIVMVVLFHSDERVRINLGDYSELLRVSVDAAAPIRMPTLVFLSGMLLAGSLSKGTRRYLDGKLRNIAWPFLVWSVLTGLMHYSMQPFTGTPHTLTDLLEIPLHPPAGLWFLQNLLLFYVLALLLRRVPRPTLIVIGLTAAALTSIQSDLFWLTRFAYLFAFFMLGDLMAQDLERWGRIVNDTRAVLPAYVAIAVLIAFASLGIPTTWVVYLFPLAVGAIVALTHLSQALQRSRLGRPIAYLGRNSMQVYVVHMLAIPLVFRPLRPVLEARPLVLVAVVIAATMTISLVPVWLRAVAPQVQWFFSFPRAVLPGSGSPTTGPRRLTPHGSRAQHR
jgi:uncharacterized membrane protein YcfT